VLRVPLRHLSAAALATGLLLAGSSCAAALAAAARPPSLTAPPTSAPPAGRPASASTTSPSAKASTVSQPASEPTTSPPVDDPATSDPPNEPTTSPPTTSPPTTSPPPTSPPAPQPPAITAPSRAERVAWFALAQVGKPYVFGADGPDTFDCSGLTRTALLTVGVDVPHHAAWQATRGRAVAKGDIRPGDLVFTAGGRPRHDLGHVGIAVSATEWVDAPAPGRRVERAPIPFGRIQAVRRLVGA
jgi:peptidoglycan DL-endopeptidase CwlO